MLRLLLRNLGSRRGRDYSSQQQLGFAAVPEIGSERWVILSLLVPCTKTFSVLSFVSIEAWGTKGEAVRKTFTVQPKRPSASAGRCFPNHPHPPPTYVHKIPRSRGSRPIVIEYSYLLRTHKTAFHKRGPMCTSDSSRRSSTRHL